MGCWNPDAGRCRAYADTVTELCEQLIDGYAELAERVGGDGRQISRYENGRITPSLDALARLAEALNVSLDHLVFDEIARWPLHAPEHALVGRLAAIAELPEVDQRALLDHLDALLTRTRLRTITSGSN